MLPKWLMKWANKPISVVIDTREQTPLNIKHYFPDCEIKNMALAHGDYSLFYPNMVLDVCIERKSLNDLVQSILKDSEKDGICNNFKKTLLAMRGYRYKLVVIEASLSDVLSSKFHSAISPNSILGFISYWMGVQGIPFLFADSADGASYIVAKMLQNIAERELKLSILANKVFPDIAKEHILSLGNIPDNVLEGLQ